jgi:hypothetical protein
MKGRYEQLCIKQEPPTAVDGIPIDPTVTNVVFSDPFELRGHQDVNVAVYANVDSGWVSMAGDLVNEETGLVQPFEVPVEYYHGVAGGETWAEGSRTADTSLATLPPGRYTLRLECQTDSSVPVFAMVTVTNGQFPGELFALALAILGLWWGALVGLSRSFIVRRWANADQPAPSGWGNF